MNKKTKHYTITLVIPTYNREKMLRDAIESAIFQVDSIDEIIIIDNHSDDKTFSIAQEYAKKFDNIQAFQNEENIGMINNWNRGASKATSEYISILHSDDIIPQNWSCFVRHGLQEATRHGKSPAILFGIAVKVRDVRSQMRVISQSKPFHKNRFLYPKVSVSTLWSRFYFNVNNSASIVYSRNVFHKMSGFDARRNIEADQDLHMRILNRYPIYFIARELVYYRIHALQSFDMKQKRKTNADTVDIILRSISIQRDNLGDKKYLLQYYFCYVLLYAIRLICIGDKHQAKKLLSLPGIFNIRTFLHIPLFVISEMFLKKVWIASNINNRGKRTYSP